MALLLLPGPHLLVSRSGILARLSRPGPQMSNQTHFLSCSLSTALLGPGGTLQSANSHLG